MHSLSTGSWKELEMGDFYCIQKFPLELSVLMEVFFWFGWGLFHPVLVSFDIATEVFTLTPIHTFESNVDVAEYGLCPTTLQVYGNKIGMCDGWYFEDEDSKTYSINMWMIEEAASESGKSYSCTERYRIPISNVLQPLCIWRNEIVCTYGASEAEVEGDPENFLYLFNLTTKEWKFPNFSAACGHCENFNYEKSLTSVLQLGCLISVALR